MIILRLYLIGLCILTQTLCGLSVNAAYGPDNNLALTLAAIKGAQHSILLNIYEFTSEPIADAIIERLKVGVHIEILQEGNVVGGFSANAKKVQNKILAAIQLKQNGDKLLEMNKSVSGKRRYVVNHGKYALIDDSRLLIGSENYSPTGHSIDGKKGNRGWEVLVNDAKLVQQYREIFSYDTDESFGDVRNLTSQNNFESILFHLYSFLSSPSFISLDPVLVPNPISAPASLAANSVQVVTSPDNSLQGLLEIINRSETALDIEQMTFSSRWGNSEEESPMRIAVVKAAQRGVKVRVLLNDEHAFGGGTKITKNEITMDYLNSIAQLEKLPLEARIANLKKMQVKIIHNKGLLSDKRLSLISSINWNENSIEKNREAAIVIDSSEVYQYYQAVFQRDWANSQPIK